jgi:hypothetical protein
MSEIDLPILPHLAPEFYSWVWFASESMGGMLSVVDDKGIDVEVWVEDRMSFRNPDSHTMRATVVGENAPQSPEARAALASGKILHDIQLHLKTEEREYSFMLKGLGMDISGLKLPPHSGDGFQALFYERVFFMQDAQRILKILYILFAKMRVSPQWDDIIVPAMKKWLLGEDFSIDFQSLIDDL